jgi:succinylglutamate desuccinylase
MKIKPIIITLQGTLPGKRVAIFCGVHGNERAGVMTVDYLKKNLVLTKGEVVLVYANPPAIENNVRQINQNLNRSFFKKTSFLNYEDEVASELMQLLDTCEALLDLHSYRELLGEGVPFLICSPDCFDLASKFDFGIVASGFDAIEKGSTDGYMLNTNKIGVCAELGATETPEKFTELGIKTSYQFLQHFDLIEQEYPFDSVKQSFIEAGYIYKKASDEFEFSKKFKTFDLVSEGETIATDGEKELSAPFNGRILFPQSTSPIGVEAYILARDLNVN